MTTRPCQLKKTVEVNIPRPRSYETQSSAFRALLSDVNEAVQKKRSRPFRLANVRWHRPQDRRGIEKWKIVLCKNVLNSQIMHTVARNYCDFFFLIIWQFGALIDDWTGYDMLGIDFPPPIDVLITC